MKTITFAAIIIMVFQVYSLTEIFRETVNTFSYNFDRENAHRKY